MELVSAIPSSSAGSAGWLKGRVIGALICGFFGAIWMFEAVYLGGMARPVWLPLIWIATLGFIIWPVVRLRSFSPQPRSSAEGERWASVSKTYWGIVAIEWGLCAGAANWLGHTHRYQLIPVFLGAIIGIHFLPLAKLFRVPIYYVTGFVMTFGVLATVLIPNPHVRNIAAYSVNGLTLWATAAVILWQDWSQRNESESH
ncbi:hypothetical protein [Terriglobus sp. RCC_193]|uniref:hypothetical protein n=1 Tax=Terriglobus sp. RCC_193 TaxID=3239218 RepID=UPI00352688F7